MTLYIFIYVLVGLGTALVIKDISLMARVGTLVAWPLYWFSFAFAHFIGIVPGKCAWCGKTIAGHRYKDKWRAHYLDECEEHPLAAKARHLKSILDEDTVLIEKLKAELKPYKEIQKRMLTQGRIITASGILTGYFGREDGS
jgi:hypothetical protein